MLQPMRAWLRQHDADLAMIFLVFVIGFNFIVVKDAVTRFEPMTFNAIRFIIGGIVMAGIALRRPHLLQVRPRDIAVLLALALFGLVGYQVLFVNSLRYTTTTNSALLIATMPTFVAIIGIITHTVKPVRGLVIGLGMTLAGVTLVVLGGAGKSGPSFSGDDLIGSMMALAAAVLLAGFVHFSKPLIDRYGGMTNSLYKHWFTGIGLCLIALPDLIALRPSDIPLSLVPNLLYSGILAGVSGFVISNYAIGKLGPTRFANYQNFAPLVTAGSGVLVLGESLTAGLIFGGILTLIGVSVVHNFAHRQRDGEPQSTQIRAAAIPASAE